MNQHLAALVDGDVTSGPFGLGLRAVRFADTTLIDAATNNTPLELTFGYAIDADHRLTFIAHEVYLPKPKLSISGPGGIQATFEWQAAKATSVARMFTVELVNDVSSY
ncbi:phage tail tube protein [Azospira oryzae]|uniref:phage tail tube protein n=1 Tax=Azospira oryzae TaxID=146939 RepID=UPI001F052069|nr:phage tail tube protein [Azospira oryzae]